ncbi:hypothetical protein [Marinomonas ostreistagni]|uniref:hypothetical protein n=1 Tax=Marinomonas ostreistagni TaxID=359209 RepID=UPI00194E9EDA|nr:hypothetical protein [Marinomonas ostreistagni]MBM6550009.1 hypothetical protein [Marinomonas ostreistagni]
MEKWILWGLLEAATIMTIASIWLLWRAYRLRHKDAPTAQADAGDSAPSTAVTESSDEDSPGVYKLFTIELEAQANAAADTLKALRDSDDLDTVTQYKVWGTLAKAERAIILNDASDHPQAIVNRFMASIINTLESIQNRQLDQSKLIDSIKELDQEFVQASDIIISKESLIENQKLLHNELQESIEFATQKVNRLGVKSTELQRLNVELKKLQEQIHQLESHDHHSNDYIGPQDSNHTQAKQHHSSTHLKQLERLSQRQQAIIEHLQAELDSDHSSDDKEHSSRTVALERMERLSIESQSLIDQLQNELESTNLSIESLRFEVTRKDQQIQALNEKIQAAEGDVLTEYQSLNSDKQLTLEEILGSIENWNEQNPPQESLTNQIAEASKLEQMLKESETCVQLLIQELETAEMENNRLRQQVDQQSKSVRQKPTKANSPIAELEQLRDYNRNLLTSVQTMKEELLNQVAGKAEKELRNEYNKKSLELDRLQLAYSDLERKYLGTLR